MQTQPTLQAAAQACADGILAIQQGNRARAALRLSDLNHLHFAALDAGKRTLADMLSAFWDTLYAALPGDAS